MSSEDSFDDWLVLKMKNINLDDDVYISYIRGILDSEDPVNEKIANIHDLISEVSVHDVTLLSEEICERYNAAMKNIVEEKTDDFSVEKKLACIMEKQAQSIQKITKTSASERELKATILAQYAQISDDEEVENSHEDSNDKHMGSACSSIPQNTNASAVLEAQKDSREKSKAEYEKKKAQDKLNKEKQKQKQQERREKERKRTQKQEHRR